MSKNKYITIKNPKDTVNSDPELIFQTICNAAESNLPIESDTLDALKSHVSRLKIIPNNRVYEYVTTVFTAPYASYGLTLIIELGIIDYIIGEGVYRRMKKRDKENISMLIKNINEARPEAEHRWTLFFRCFDKNTAVSVIDKLIFDKATAEKILKTLHLVDKIYFLNNKIELKRFILKHGYDDYIFIDKIARQEKKIYNRQDSKVENRYYLMEEIKSYEEPLFIEELDITSKDLIEKNICPNEDDAVKMLHMLLDLAIKRPRLNTKEALLDKAAALKKNPFMAKFRKVDWKR